MKHIFLTYLLFSSTIFYAQNLVPNPSFEEHIGCPQFYPDLDNKCFEWLSFRGTPDYFHNCSDVCGYDNAWGYQEPHSGEAYTGVGTYQVTITNAKEHIAAQLISPLIIGEKYYISFYVSTAYTPLQMNIATNKIGALFTTHPYYYSLVPGTPSVPLPNAAHVYNDSIIADTVNWIKISNSFIADSAYNYIVIGSFFDDNNTDTLHLPYEVVPQISYYYLDDVCVSTDSLYAHNWAGIKEQNQNLPVSIYPNPTENFIAVKSDENISSVRIYNSLGQQVLSTNYKYRSNERLVNLLFLTNGIYYVDVESEGGIRTSKKIIIQKP